MAIEIELESRADAKAPKDHLHSLEHSGQRGGGGDRSQQMQPGGSSGRSQLARCPHCMKEGHFAETCPSVLARENGDAESCIAEAAKSGKSCTLCGGTDHRARHHHMAIVRNEEKKRSHQPGHSSSFKASQKGGSKGGGA